MFHMIERQDRVEEHEAPRVVGLTLLRRSPFHASATPRIERRLEPGGSLIAEESDGPAGESWQALDTLGDRYRAIDVTQYVDEKRLVLSSRSCRPPFVHQDSSVPGRAGLERDPFRERNSAPGARPPRRFRTETPVLRARSASLRKAETGVSKIGHDFPADRHERCLVVESSA